MILENKEYIGTIVYNQDPTYTGRCKVRVFGLFDDIPDDNLPWCIPANSSIFSSDGAGSISVPKIDAIVRVKFTNNDLYSGEYTILQCVDPNLIDEIKEDYEGTHVLLYDAAEELLVIYQKMSGLRIYHKGSCITLSPTGMIQAKHQNNKNVVEINENDITITTAAGSDASDSVGIINITSGNIVNINALSTINLNSNDVRIGNNAELHVAVAERVEAALKAIVEQLALKTPQGCPGLMGNDFKSIRSKVATLSN